MWPVDRCLEGITGTAACSPVDNGAHAYADAHANMAAATL